VKVVKGFKLGGINGTIRTIMILGHYVDVNVQCGEEVIKSFVPRVDLSDLYVGDDVHIEFGVHNEFPN
jgi:putative spermidine/putrescine transport system ATP-binding protein